MLRTKNNDEDPKCSVKQTHTHDILVDETKAATSRIVENLQQYGLVKNSLSHLEVGVHWV